MDYRIILFKGGEYTEVLAEDNLALAPSHLVRYDGESVSLDGDRWEMYASRALANGVTALLFSKQRESYSTVNVPVLRIGGGAAHISPAADDVRAVIEGGRINVISGAFYLNGSAVAPGFYRLFDGDTLMAGGVEIVYRAGEVSCAGPGYRCGLNRSVGGRGLFEGFPQYTRSPRIIKREPSGDIELLAPKNESEKAKKGQLLRLLGPPLGMLAATMITSMVMGGGQRGIAMLAMGFTTVITAVISITNFVEDKKEAKLKAKEQAEAYDKYLLRQRKALHKRMERFLESKRYHNPSVPEIERMIGEYSNRIYERRSSDADFLQISLGVSESAPSFSIKAGSEAIETNKDPQYLEMMRVRRAFEAARDVPVVVDLKNAHLGIVGEEEYIHNQLHAIIAQLAFMQSYHDIEIITLVDERFTERFSWIRWYPHCKVKSINISSLVSGENQRDQVLGNIAQVLKSRKQYNDEAKKDSLFTPYYIFVIETPRLIINHSIMEYLQAEDTGLGFCMIYTTNLLSNLPDNVRTVLMLDTGDSGTLLLNEGAYENRAITTHDISRVDLEAMSRGLAPLVHNKGVSTQIPESITFFELYGVKHPEELPVLSLWGKNASHKSMAVPLGVRAKDDVVYLNLHEKSHGPHGLVAGTTGSGKSEILQSYILSLGVNFHPHEVGFLLIDYKGGGMANLFKDMPHLLGTITNLDGSESLRALASIKSELARRQRVFNASEVNNINQYTRLFKAGKAPEPLPHLFIISDEFAELKKEQPDFMRELVSAARIGRSLGVHLILATQKPSGVVDDQIWSNSKFKLALKVQNESDSNEVIKTPDAARITQPGRAILQVGNNEIYEMFQSAWSGAGYSEERQKAAFDNRVYLINELGQGVLLNEDLSAVSGAEEASASQLDVTVAHIGRVYAQTNSAAVEKPWLPPLGDRIVSPHIRPGEIADVAEMEDADFSAAMGVVDIPEEQKQQEFVHDFIKDGNIAVFGASGFGKSTAIVNMALSLAVKISPLMLNCFVLDLGNSSLIPLKALPHTADYLGFDDSEKLNKLFRMLGDEIAARKKLFAAENAINFKMYNSVAEKRLPVIVFFIDNYDVVKEMENDAEEHITRITRDGPGLGIYTVITATRSNAVRYAVLNNFKNKLCNFMFDTAEIYSLVGRSQYVLPEIKGRAMVKRGDVCVMQEYLPVAFEDDVSYAAGIRGVVGEISDKCSSPGARGIPMLPEAVSEEALLTAVPPGRSREVAIGLDTEWVEPQFLAPGAQVQLIVGSAQTGKTNILKLVMRQYAEDTIFLADSRSGDLQHYSGAKRVTYMSARAQAAEFIKKLNAAAVERQRLFKAKGGGIRAKDFYSGLPRAGVFIDDIDAFVENCADVSAAAEEAVSGALATGMVIYATTIPSKMRGYDAVTKLIKDTLCGVVTGHPGDQAHLQIPAMRQYKAENSMAFICKSGQNVLVKVPLI